MSKLSLNPNEMAFRKIYKDLLEQEKVTTIFRPGRRLCGDFRGYCPGQKVTIKVIEKTGADWALLRPKFIHGFSKKIIIKTVEAKPLKEFKKADFVGSTPDVKDIQSLKYNLGIIYKFNKC